jgi:O-antigen ligase
VIGCSIFLMPYRHSRRKMMALALGTFGILTVAYLVVQDPEASDRWLMAYEGDTAGRDKIIAAAIEMIAEKPIWGWQPTVAFLERAWRLGRKGGMDAHNLILYVLLEVGVVGTIPFIIGVASCVRQSWKARVGRLGILPVALLGVMLAANMTHTSLKYKPTWFFLALGLAAGSVVESEQKKRERLAQIVAQKKVSKGQEFTTTSNPS